MPSSSTFSDAVAFLTASSIAYKVDGHFVIYRLPENYWVGGGDYG